MSKDHELKTWPRIFRAIKSGLKPWEYRKNDRDFEVGDRLILKEYCPYQSRYLGEKLQASITFMVKGPEFGIPNGYAIMSLGVVDEYLTPEEWCVRNRAFDAKQAAQAGKGDK